MLFFLSLFEYSLCHHLQSKNPVSKQSSTRISFTMALYRDTDEQERKLFVGGLNKDLTSEEKLKNFFKDCGEIVDVTIMRDTNKVSRGFGFVLFEDHKSVDLIMTRKREDTKFELDGHNIEVKRALPRFLVETLALRELVACLERFLSEGLQAQLLRRMWRTILSSLVVSLKLNF